MNNNRRRKKAKFPSRGEVAKALSYRRHNVKVIMKTIRKMDLLILFLIEFIQ